MNNETFLLLRTAQGLQQEDVVKGLDVSLRTVQRWDAGQKPIPEFAQVWITEKWEEFLDRVDEFMAAVDDLPSGREVELPTDQNWPMTIREVNAMNRALAVCLGLADLAPVVKTIRGA